MTNFAGYTRRFAWVAAAFGFAAALAVVYWYSWQAPAVGLYHDDGLYLVTAKALAEGKGYRLISLPSEIPQTKYPFLFPAVLAVLVKLSPHFPENVALLKTVPLICSLLWFVCSWKLLIRLGARKVPATWIMLLTAASPLTIFLSTNLMSEPLFALLCTGSLLALTAVEDGGAGWLAVVAGALAGLAFLTRSIGIAIIAGPAIALLVQKRFGTALRFGIAGGAAGCLWPIWLGLHAATSDPAQLYYSSTNYASWNILLSRTWPEKVQVFALNLLMAFASPATLLQMRPSGVWAFLFFLIVIAVVSRFARVRAIDLFVATYILLVLCWAWPPERFLQMMLPFILFAAWKVIEQTLPARSAMLVLLALTSIVSLHLLYAAISGIRVTERLGSFPLNVENADSWPETLSVAKWLRENTKTSDVILANLDPVIYLFSGRKAIRDFVPDSYKLFYAPDAPSSDALGSLEQIITASGAAYLVVMPDRGFAESSGIQNNVSLYKARFPDRLRRIDRPGADPGYVIYRIRR